MKDITSRRCIFVSPDGRHMSDAPPPAPQGNLPDGIPAPPPPRPDLKDIRHEGPTYGSEKSKKKKKKERTHPTDPYEPLRKKGCGCCGCLGGSLVAVVILLIALVGAVIYLGPGRFVSEGYTVVNLEGAEVTVSTAPEVPTLYIGQTVTYSATVTSVAVAIVAKEVTLSGDFLKEVSITGAKVTGLATARFAENLEIYAGEFFDQGITLKGELTGRVMKSLQ
ncbi:MAG: hypothetical protein NWT04_16305 [Verrucomicrobiales bacterium]|nr:hypothetical protein [Verrucomicrobiales bacterium]